MAANELPVWLVRAIAFVFGSLWGSFFNVAIYRWPRGMSVVSPPSSCPSCGKRIDPTDNIPIFGWLLLRGKARCCGAKISARYPFVELLGAVLATACAEKFFIHGEADASAIGAAGETLAYFAFAGGLLIATFVDLEHMEIPDEVSLPGAALGLATAPLRSWPGAEDAALGAGGGFLVVQLLFVWTYERLFGRRGMGEGDSKLLMMIGAFVGWRGAIFAVVVGAMQGLVAAGASLALGRHPTPEKVRAAEANGGDADAMKAESKQAADATKAESNQAADATKAESNQATDASPANESNASAEPVSATPREPSEKAAEADAGKTGAIKVPFGPFLALGALEFMFFGEALIDWYVRWMAGA